MNWFLFSIFISLAVSLATSVAWSKSSAEIARKLESNFCAAANPSFNSSPGANASQTTEAQMCVKCTKHSNSPSSVPLDLSKISPDEKTRIRRNIELFRWYEKKFVGPFIASICGKSIPDCEDSLKIILEKLSAKKQTLKNQTKNSEDTLNTLTELKNLSSGKGLSSNAQETIRHYLPLQIALVPSDAKYLNSAKSSQGMSNYGKERLAQTTTIKKTRDDLPVWSQGPCDQPPADTVQFETLQNRLKDQVTENKWAIEHLNADLKSLNENLKIIEDELAILKDKTAAPEVPTEENARMQFDLNIFETNYSNHAYKYVHQNSSDKIGNLSVAERFAIKTYTGQSFQAMKKALRLGNGSAEEYRLFQEVVSSALRKLNPYEGEVRRGFDLPPEVLANYQVGNTVTLNAYTSASRGEGFCRNHRFIIKSKDCRYFAPLSENYYEYEVLLEHDARFKVLSRQETAARIEFASDELESEKNAQEILK